MTSSELSVIVLGIPEMGVVPETMIIVNDMGE
jgi:hypothetical protein